MANTVKLGDSECVSRSIVTTRSCIACKQRGLGLGRRAVDFVRQQERREDGPLMSENSLRCRLKTLVPVMSAGIRSGVNWMRAKSQPEHVGQRAHEQSFGDAGHAFDERMVAGEDGDERLFDDVVLALVRWTASERALAMPAA